MAKEATRYLDVDPWHIIEKGFHPDRSRVSESVFSLGNECMGVRGYFEEGYSGETLQGSYFNGVFEDRPIHHANRFKGMSNRLHFMVNACNWLHTRICLDGETLDLNSSSFSDFERVLDLRVGVLTRRFIWTTRKSGWQLQLTFQRFTSMAQPHLGVQRVVFRPLNFSGSVNVRMGVDFGALHTGVAFGTQSDVPPECFWEERTKGETELGAAILGETRTSQQRIFSGFGIKTDCSAEFKLAEAAGLMAQDLSIPLAEGVPATVDKRVWNVADKTADTTVEDLWERGVHEMRRDRDLTFETALADHTAYWDNVWNTLDVTIEGDPANQQGVRFCIFQMHQTYHGVDPTLNVGAKGLTGEAYCGHTFWDTETYCLPFYLFSNPAAAKNLLLYRYNTLPQAKERARELDCEGARFPMCTIDGTEACGVWQHGDLEIHVPAAVAYGVWHYANVTGDTEFLFKEGIEMLVELSRYYASRGQWSPTTGEFGFWGVMGADEFHMMVHNNAYTNVMAKKCFEWTCATLDRMKREKPAAIAELKERVGLNPSEREDWGRKASRMRTQRDPETGLIEQHDGYFDLPHIDCGSIPPTEFPLYKHWAYYRIFRYDMIKQPDVLLLPFFFSTDYSLAEKRVNFDYYEPRCIHESSLSPGVHAILAAELGRHETAYQYAQHASRLDLDDYNRNSHEGLHTTSMAAAWMLVTYGFGGMRSDGERLSLAPAIPAAWDAFSFRVLYEGSVLEVKADKDTVNLRVVKGAPVEVDLFGEPVSVNSDAMVVYAPGAK